MTGRTPGPKATDAVTLDLRAYSATLAGLLPSLLFSHDREALTRWATVRSWVDNALAGDEAPELETIGLAVAYLTQRDTDAAAE